MLKLKEEEITKLLNKIFQKIWNTEQTAEERKKGMIIKLSKKSDLKDCNSW